MHLTKNPKEENISETAMKVTSEWYGQGSEYRFRNTMMTIMLPTIPKLQRARKTPLNGAWFRLPLML